MTGPVGDVLFRESQSFRQFWLWFVIVAITGVLCAVLLWGSYVQFVEGRPWGDKPMPDIGLAVITSLSVLGSVLLIVWFLYMRMTTEVYENGVRLRFRGLLVDRFLPWERLDRYSACTYRPLIEFGGWGVRGIGKKRALNVSGDRGVRLIHGGDHELMVGSRRPDELAAAIEKASGKAPEPEAEAGAEEPDAPAGDA